MLPEISVFLIVFGAILVQTLVGFGSALIAMPLLTSLIGLHIAAPMFVMVGLLTKLFMIRRYRHAFKWSAIWRLLLASIVSIPVGVHLADILPQHTTLVVLGAVIALYALVNIFGLPMFTLSDQRWAFAFGILSGLLSGAFNVGGPPYIIYGTSQHWQPDEFKGNLQAAYLFSTLTLLLSHTLNGSINEGTIHYFVVAVPAVLGGLSLGFWLERFISPHVFRRAVFVLLLWIGLSLALS